MIPRTPDQIVARIAEVAARDSAFGVERSRLLEALPYDRAREFLHDDAPHTSDSWEQQRPKTCDDVRAQIRDFLTFSWGKSNARRGASAHRMIANFRGLLWLLGDDAGELASYFDDPSNYRYYGKPHLVRVSEFVGFDWRAADDDRWVNADGDEPLTADAALAGIPS